MKRLLTVLACLVASAALATTFTELSLSDMTSRADIGFLGTVDSIELEMRNGDPWTLVTFEVQELLLGELEDENNDDDEARLTLAFFGGSQDGTDLTVSGMPEFSPGEEVMILAYDADYYSPIVGFSQALWRSTARGFEDDFGRLLSLDDDDALQLDGEGGASEDILEALRARLVGGS